MYSTSSEHTRLTWTAHGYNVAYSDEIGHFEYCDVVINGKCKSAGATDSSKDGDDVGCFDASQSLLVLVSGCLGTDTDFDGCRINQAAGRGRIAPGRYRTRSCSRARSSTGPRTTAGSHSRPTCRESRGGLRRQLQPNGRRRLREPAAGGELLPDLLDCNARRPVRLAGRRSRDPGHDEHVRGNSTAEFGPLFQLFYPVPRGVSYRYNNFRNTLTTDTCPA